METACIRSALLLSFVSLSASTPAFAGAKGFVPRLGSGEPLKVDEALGLFDMSYQIGSEWGKKPVTAQDLDDVTGLGTIARATAQVGGATGFFIGKFNGEMVMATNHHVCPSACRGSVSFPILGKSFRVKRTLGTWNEIDLTLFTITVPSATDEELLLRYGRNFAFEQQLYRGQELVTAGFGIADNPRRQLRGNWDSDCKVFSDAGEFRIMRDPDARNPGPDAVWSFSNGCDVSHGDSGSAMVDRATGDVVGIIWTGKIPKSAKVQNSAVLDELLAHPTEDVWTELSYGVPAAKIHAVLTQALQQGRISGDARATVAAVVGVP